MIEERIEGSGFSLRRGRRSRRRRLVFVQLIAAAGLVASLAVAATAVSIEIARADGAAVHAIR